MNNLAFQWRYTLLQIVESDIKRTWILIGNKNVSIKAIEECKPSLAVYFDVDSDRVLSGRLLRILLLAPRIEMEDITSYLLSFSIYFRRLVYFVNTNYTCWSFNAEVSINLVNFKSSATFFPIWVDTNWLFSYISIASSRRSFWVPTIFKQGQWLLCQTPQCLL